MNLYMIRKFIEIMMYSMILMLRPQNHDCKTPLILSVDSRTLSACKVNLVVVFNRT